jgi:hypothetical protein
MKIISAIQLDNGDVIRLKYPMHHFSSDVQTFVLKDFYGFIRQKLSMTKEELPIYHWLGKGVMARILRSDNSSQGWIEGNISLMIVFQPENTSSATIHPQMFTPEEEDVLEIPQQEARIGGLSGICITQLVSRIRSNLGLTDPTFARYYWLDPRGIECSVLRSNVDNSGWQSGLVRLQLGFLPKVGMSSPENAVVGNSELESLRQPITS